MTPPSRSSNMNLRQTPSRRARSASMRMPSTNYKKRRNESVSEPANCEATTPQQNEDKPTSSETTTPQFNYDKPTNPEPTTPENNDVEIEPFRFLCLPAELREKIYKYCLCSPEPLALAIPPSATTGRLQRKDCVAGEGQPHPHHYSYPENTDEAMYAAPKGGAQGNLHLTTAILRTSKQVHKEATKVLYSDNMLYMRAPWGPKALQRMKQQQRSLIRRVTIEIPQYPDITDGFVDIIRLGLRYCFGLKHLMIVINAYPPSAMIDVDKSTAMFYGDPFRILRWLPKKCVVTLEGMDPPECVRKVIEKEAWYMRTLDDVSC